MPVTAETDTLQMLISTRLYASSSLTVEIASLVTLRFTPGAWCCLIIVQNLKGMLALENIISLQLFPEISAW